VREAASALSRLLVYNPIFSDLIIPGAYKAISKGKWRMAKFKWFYLCPAAAGSLPFAI
jgi:hypothetical protein